jgi:hypothetical protein
MSDFEINGADQFLKLSKALKAAGATQLRKELNKGLRQATKPLIADTRASALEHLPKAGGLAALVAKSPQRVRVTTGKDPGVSIVVAGGKKSGAYGAEIGVVRHPVFGHKDRFVSQNVKPGWFSEPLAAGASKVLPELEKAIDAVMGEVIRNG